MSTPTVRATRGRRSGPITMSATAPMMASLSMPKSIMLQGAAKPLPVMSWRSGLGLGVDVDGVAVLAGSVGHLLGRCLRGGAAVLHAVLETLDGRAQVAADVLELLGAKDHHHDEQHDHPVPDAERTHDHPPSGLPARVDRKKERRRSVSQPSTSSMWGQLP